MNSVIGLTWKMSNQMLMRYSPVSYGEVNRYLWSGDIAGIDDLYTAGSWVVNSDITQNEGWYGNISVEPDNGSDYIYKEQQYGGDVCGV